MLLSFQITSCAYRGELQPVVEWLQKGGHVDALDEDGHGLLLAAAAGGRLRVAKELLQRGASVDLRGTMGGTALKGGRRDHHRASGPHDVDQQTKGLVIVFMDITKLKTRHTRVQISDEHIRARSTPHIKPYEL